MERKSLVMVSPHNWYDHVKPNRINRPLKFVEQYYNETIFKKVIIVNRLHPKRIINIQDNERKLVERGVMYNLLFDKTREVYYLEHCFPFGKVENYFLPFIINRIIKKIGLSNIVLWICDPKSVYLFKGIKGLKIFDAYDDWSLSPLFQKRTRHLKYIN
ncbi:hypothetical protein, partial [Neobacillus vireti]|uniref:hypothetical protein n=1 Tax=Neobacillus vireti TaxID=220686 RepID=UPI002FFFE782